MIEIPTVDQLEVLDARVFYRVDYNVPLDGSRVTDTTRIEETLPTLLMLRERGAGVIVGSHLGRPKGSKKEEFSLKPVRDKLQWLLNKDILFADDCVGEHTRGMVAALRPGEILVLENLRFHPGEEKNDTSFAAELRELADFYVNDAFGASHRAHASIDALPRLFSRDRVAGGLLLIRELEFLQKVTDVSERPFVGVLGGAKIAGKIEPLQALVNLADQVLIGGGMANTFLAAQGHPLGASLVDSESLEVARRILAGSSKASIELPSDLIVTDDVKNPSYVKTVAVDAVGPSDRAVDIGPETVQRYSAALQDARTIFWNGPMGVFEREQFARGTMALASAIAESGATSIVGGGESVQAVNKSGFADRISHISTGGGASLEFISGASLPGITVLQEALNAPGN